MPNVEDADDVVATTFLTAWRRINEAAQLDWPLAWLYRVAYLTLANHWRSGRHAAKVADRAAHEIDPSRPDRAAEHVAGRQELARVLDALGTLSERDQEVLRLVAFEDLGPSEIATVIGVREATARTVLYRARRRLQHALDTIEQRSGRAPQ